jgi:hypothetical protein
VSVCFTIVRGPLGRKAVVFKSDIPDIVFLGVGLQTEAHEELE